MTLRSMRGPFGSFSLFFVVAAVVLTAAGLIWAHWYTSLRVDANVNTGNVGIEWWGAWTNDDGVVNDGWDPGDDGSNGAFSNWGDGSSVDPADFGDARYDKDVAACFAGGGGGHLDVSIENGYPSYHCRVLAEIHNPGSVPIKALPSEWTMERGFYVCDVYDNSDLSGDPLPIRFGDSGEYIDTNGNDVFDEGIDPWLRYDEGGPYADANYNDVFDDGDARLYDECRFEGDPMEAMELEGGLIGWGFYEDDVFVPEVTGYLPELFACGYQIDPGFSGATEFGFHVEQAAEQNATYHFSMDQEFVNWNEFDFECPIMVDPGSPDKEKGFGVRYRSLANTGGEEIYIGVGDLGDPLNRNASEYTWGAAQTVTFTYDGAGNLAAAVDGVEQVTYSGVGGSCADFLVMSVVARDPGSTVMFNDVTVNGAGIGSFSADGDLNEWNEWTISGVDFSSAFTVEGALEIAGPFSTSQEKSKVELLVACSP